MKNLKKIGRQDLKEVYGAGPVPAYPCNCFCYINNVKQWNPCNQYCPGGVVIPGVEPGNDPKCDYKLPL
ncbi:bacteriocin-like protein [Chryseobacterium gossypii]|uniref:bacteriocin-like protein n=1 Tax=Chryseobacterium gossypii TaxID=3231602 RepID=UPI0035257216